MARLSLTLLGGFEVVLDGRPVTAFESDQMRALLAYLAVEANRSHARSALAGLLWPDQPEERARTNLRHVLYELRLALGDGEGGAPASFLSTRQSIQFNSASDYALDVARFVTLLAECDAHVHAALPACAECMPRLGEAVALYGGNFLAGLNVSGSLAFEEWARVMQERLYRRALEALHALATFAEAHGDLPAALRYARRQVELEPWREEAHQQLMRALALDGQHSAALAQFESLRRLLSAELGVAPSAESVALYERVKAWGLGGGGSRGSDISDLAPRLLGASAPDSENIPDPGPFYGRQTELAQLASWIGQERCRVVAVLGLGGMGKTALAAAFARAHAGRFDRVIWRSLVNAPPLDDVLSAMLQTLSGQTLTGLPASLDDQLDLLLGYVRTQRCLIVLDNLETLLQAEPAGAFRPGYEAYAQLLQRLAEHAHQSCLVLTSRERPSVFSRWDEGATAVRTLRLNGLDDAAARTMLSARGLSSQGTDAVTLAERYSGNPLALKLVTQTVHDLFGGDIAAFLGVETPIFGDIRAVLDQQFARLSDLERDVMVWLAVEREPVTFQMLQEVLVGPVTVNALVEALRSLQRRSLIVHSANGFSLQNVVLEYTTDLLVDQICAEIKADKVTGRQGDKVHESGDAKSPSHPVTLSFLNRFALLKAQAREYVRASQARLILSPIAGRLLTSLGTEGLTSCLKRIIAALRAHEHLIPGYAAGNVINLLLRAGVDLSGCDFSELNVWQAYLQGKSLSQVNFSRSNLAHSVFTFVFGKIEDIHFDASGDLLVAGSIEGRLGLWRAADGQLIRSYHGFGADVRIATISPDGRLLACGDTDQRIRVWDVTGGNLLHTLPGYTQALWGLTFSPDGRTLASSSGAGDICLRDVATGEVLHTLVRHTTGTPALAFTPDGRTLASGDVDGNVCVWRLGEPEPVLSFRAHLDEVHAMAFDGAGQTLITSSHDRTIRLWNANTGRKLGTLKAHTFPIRALVMSPDGHTFVSAGEDQFACVWDLRSAALDTDLRGAGQPTHVLMAPIHRDPCVKFSPDGRRLAIMGAHPSVDLWDVATGQRLESLQAHTDHVMSVAFSPDNATLASGGTDHKVRLWAVGKKQMADRLPEVRVLNDHAGAVLSVSFSPDGNTLTSAGEGPSIRLWDVEAGRVIATLEGHTDDVECVQFSRDGRRMVSAGRDKTVRVWDLRSTLLNTSLTRAPRGLATHVLHGHTDRVRCCAISLDGRWAASGSTDRTVRLWDLQSPSLNAGPHRDDQVIMLHGHTNGVRCVAFSPEGDLLASGSYDQTLRLWDVRDGGKPLGVWPLHDTLVLSVAFHPGGQLLATGTGDYLVRLWDVGTRRLLHTLHGHKHRVEALGFSPDGRRLASASFDETIQVWDVETGECALVLLAPGPYAGMNISGVTGISPAQKAVLKALGAVET